MMKRLMFLFALASASNGAHTPSFLQSVEADTNTCCFSDGCLADKSCSSTCMPPSKTGNVCSNYECRNCECCTCCDAAIEHCIMKSTGTAGVPGSGHCCPLNFSGDDCSKAFCKQDCGDHGTCTAPNTCTCKTGWSGASCQVPVCTTSCGDHGMCSAPDTCTCKTGWKGDTCQTPICTTSCGEHGSCSAPDTCTCVDGWSGPTCETALCKVSCGAHGTCTSPDTCTCAPHWEGPKCDKCVPEAFKVSKVQNETFTVSSVELGGCRWADGTKASLTVTGKVVGKQIKAGAVSWNLYEDGEQEFVASGTRDYFVCNNHGCNTSHALALDLKTPDANSSLFSLTFPFNMVLARKTGSFRIVAFGQDQDHYPYDFSVTTEYKYSDSSVL